MVDWNKASDNTVKMAHAIARRARDEGIIKGSTMDLEMDITAAATVLPMKLNELYKEKTFNFFHDVCGIMRHIDRDTGNLMHCFLPRCAR